MNSATAWRPGGDWIEVNGVSLRYQRSGRSGPLVVLVHEMCGCIESWDEAMPALGDGLRVLRYDQRGFGQSEKQRDLTLDAQVADLAALLAALRVDEPVWLAGGALGATVCLAFAHAYPARVAGLMVASPATSGPPTEAGRAAMTRWLQQVADGGMRAITDAMFVTTYPPALAVPPERVAQHRLRWLATDPESFIALIRMSMTLDLAPLLPAITAPVTVIGCRHDLVRPPAAARGVADRIPGARYEEADSAHYFAVQSPELFAATLRRCCGVDGDAPDSVPSTT